MMLTAAIFAVLLALPVASVDRGEDPRNREARLQETAAAISSAVQHAMCAGAWDSSPDCRRIWGGEQIELAAAVMAVAWEESHLARYVAEDLESVARQGFFGIGRTRPLAWATLSLSETRNAPRLTAKTATAFWIEFLERLINSAGIAALPAFSCRSR